MNHCNFPLGLYQRPNPLFKNEIVRMFNFLTFLLRINIQLLLNMLSICQFSFLMVCYFIQFLVVDPVFQISQSQ